MRQIVKKVTLLVQSWTFGIFMAWFRLGQGGSDFAENIKYVKLTFVGWVGSVKIVIFHNSLLKIKLVPKFTGAHRLINGLPIYFILFLFVTSTVYCNT